MVLRLEILSNEQHLGKWEPLVWENTQGSCYVAGHVDWLCELQGAELGSRRPADFGSTRGLHIQSYVRANHELRGLKMWHSVREAEKSHSWEKGWFKWSWGSLPIISCYCTMTLHTFIKPDSKKTILPFFSPIGFARLNGSFSFKFQPTFSHWAPTTDRVLSVFVFFSWTK